MAAARIFIATHKPAPFPTDEGYVPFHNGKIISEGIPGLLLGDDAGENISSKVPIYSECCTLYWLWKNCNDQIVGLSHYRRYFRYRNISVRVGDFEVASSYDFHEIGPFDIVIAEPIEMGNRFGFTLRQQYSHCHREDDLNTMRNVVSIVSPDHLYYCDQALEGGSLTPFNIFVAKKGVIDAYCEWVFPIMFEIELRLISKPEDPYQQRILAFLSERLFTIWLLASKSRVKATTRPVIALPY